VAAGASIWGTVAAGAPHPCLARQLSSAPVTTPRRGGQTAATAADQEPDVQLVQPEQLHFKVHRISGDGSCMFRAIVQGVHMMRQGTPMSIPAETTAALNLRAAIVKELVAKRSEIEPFVAGITDDWDEYVKRMADPGVWGGEPEMVMAVNVIRHPLTVYRTVSGSVEPIVTYGGDLPGKVIHLLWSGAHYDLLLVSPHQLS